MSLFYGKSLKYFTCKIIILAIFISQFPVLLNAQNDNTSLSKQSIYQVARNLKNNDNEKTDENVSDEELRWRDKTNSKLATSIIFFVISGGFLIGSIASYAAAAAVDTNEYKREGNILTNQEAVDEYNQKMLIGGLCLSAFAGSMTGAILYMISYKRNLRYGRSKGFRLSYNPVNKNLGIKYTMLF